METSTVLRERRKAIRKQDLQETFLVNPHGVHQVLDISTSGLAFRCEADEAFPNEWGADILVVGTQIYIQKVTVKFVREYDDSLSTFIPAPTKKVGVRFGYLDEQTISQLLELLYLQTN